MLFFWTFYSSKNPEKKKFSQKSSTVFNIDNNKETFLELQISILEWFLKDHVTLKTGMLLLKIQLCNHMNIFLIY